MKKNILLILLVLFLTTLVSGCFVYRRDRDHRERYHGDQGHHNDEPGLQINVH